VWFATGVRRRSDHQRETKPKVPPLILSMMPLGRKRRDFLEDRRDDDEALREAAAEAEREAAEEKEGGE
jgi:hypothetical protein